MENGQESFHERFNNYIKRHRKKYIRFALFLLVLSLFRILEDYYLVSSLGLEIEIDIAILLSTVLIAVIFTLLSGVTERVIEIEEPKIEEIICEEEKAIKKRVNRKRVKRKR